MDTDSLYWLLSTIPQVGAALVAFIGFLGLSSLDEPSRRRIEMENNTRKFIQESRSTTDFGDLSKGPYSLIEAMPGNEFMKKVECVLRNPDPNSPGHPVILQAYYQSWQKLNCRIKYVHVFLAVFVVWHLLVIGLSLGLIPYIPKLIGLPYLRAGAIFVGVSMVVTTAFMIYMALYRPRL